MFNVLFRPLALIVTVLLSLMPLAACSADNTLTIVSATDPPVDRTTGDIDAFYVTRYQGDDGEVDVSPVGPRAEAAAGDLTFEASPPR